MRDRYLKIILTIIAVELLWLGVKDLGVPVSAQSNRDPMPVVLVNREPMPVVVRGIQLPRTAANRVVDALPMYGVEALTVTSTSQRPVMIETVRPMPIVGSAPLRIEVDRDRPLPVENVGYKPGAKPGE